MSNGKTFALLIGLFTGILVSIVLIRMMRKDRALKAEYDERQELIRGKAYKGAFFVSLIGNAIIICLADVFSKYISITLLLFSVMLLSVLVYAVYCIMKDAYFGLNDSPLRFIVICAVIGIFNFVIGAVTICKEHPTLTSTYPSGYLNVVCGLMFMVLFFAMMMKKIISKQEN